MQFKVVFALAFATLAAAGALPRADTDIAPPVSGNPLPTINASKCSAGHLQCCKSAQSPNAADVAPLLPSGVSAGSISGLVGVTCNALPAGAQPNACPNTPLCCTDNSHGNSISLGCNRANLGA